MKKFYLITILFLMLLPTHAFSQQSSDSLVVNTQTLYKDSVYMIRQFYAKSVFGQIVEISDNYIVAETCKKRLQIPVFAIKSVEPAQTQKDNKKKSCKVTFDNPTPTHYTVF